MINSNENSTLDVAASTQAASFPNSSDTVTLSRSDLEDMLRAATQQASALNISQDSLITTKSTQKILHKYDTLEELLPSISMEMFKFEEKTEHTEYYDFSAIPKTESTVYTAPLLPSNVHYSDKVKRHDQDMVQLTNMALKATRPIDSAAHSIISIYGSESEDVKNILHLLDCARYQMGLMSTKISNLREAAIFRDKGVVPKSDSSNNKTYLFESSTLVEQAKFTRALRRADTGNYNRTNSRGNQKSRYSYNTNRAQTTSTSSQQSNTDTSQQQDSTNQQSFRQAPAFRGRGRGKVTFK